ncbi:MAG: hypothetical protein AAF311_04095 [Pseudomonadota bacterium]
MNFSRTFLVMALSASLLSACGEDEAPNVASTSSPPIETESRSEPSVEVTYMAPGPVRVSDAKAAQDLAAQRRAETPVDPRGPGSRYPARVEPITWDYGNCTNARTLIPPPLEGWGLANDVSPGEWPIEDSNASIVMTQAGAPHDPASLGLSYGEASSSIYISSGRATSKTLQDMLDNEALRDNFFEAGPYNYPVRKGLLGEAHYETLLGPYRVLMGTNTDHDGEYFRQMIKCAIDNGLIAEGVDPATLRADP